MRLLVNNVPPKYGSVFLSSYFFFRVMAHWFGRFPLPCAGVVEVFPRIWSELLNSPSRTIEFLYSLSIRYRSTAIIRTRKISRSLSSPSFLRTDVKIPREVCSASPIHTFQRPKLSDFWPVVCALFCIFIFGILHKTLNLKGCYLLLTSPPFCFVALS